MHVFSPPFPPYPGVRPTVYTSMTIYMVDHPVIQTPLSCAAVIFAGIFCVWANYDADAMRVNFRRANGTLQPTPSMFCFDMFPFFTALSSELLRIPHVPHGDWCLHLDCVSKSRPQASARCGAHRPSTSPRPTQPLTARIALRSSCSRAGGAGRGTGTTSRSSRRRSSGRAARGSSTSCRTSSNANPPPVGFRGGPRRARQVSLLSFSRPPLCSPSFLFFFFFS